MVYMGTHAQVNGVQCDAYPDAPVLDLNEPGRHGHPIGHDAGPRCGGRLTARHVAGDVYVVFKGAGDIKRMSKRMADDWYPNRPRATFTQWRQQRHPALEHA